MTRPIGPCTAVRAGLPTGLRPRTPSCRRRNSKRRLGEKVTAAPQQRFFGARAIFADVTRSLRQGRIARQRHQASRQGPQHLALDRGIRVEHRLEGVFADDEEANGRRCGDRSGASHGLEQRDFAKILLAMAIARPWPPSPTPGDRRAVAPPSAAQPVVRAAHVSGAARSVAVTRSPCWYAF